MPVFTLFALEETNISIVDPGDATATPVLSGFNQGNGSHLQGLEITLNSNAWVAVDVFDDDANFNDSENGQVLDSATTFNNANFAAGSRVEAEYTLTLEDSAGNTYTAIGFNINSNDGFSSFGTIEGLTFVGPVSGFPPIGVPLTVIATSEGPAGGATPYSSYATPACFTPGTQVATSRGIVNVEDLVVGDHVQTKDNGFQPITWVGHTSLDWSSLWVNPNLRPVVISADAFGKGMPNRDMQVSPMHRIVMGNPLVELFFAESEVLVPASHLINDLTILRDTVLKSVTYIHFAFETHQLVCSDGLWTESFQPGVQTSNGMDQATRDELEELFPEAVTGQGGMVSARRSLSKHEAQVLLAA